MKKLPLYSIAILIALNIFSPNIQEAKAEQQVTPEVMETVTDTSNTSGNMQNQMPNTNSNSLLAEEQIIEVPSVPSYINYKFDSKEYDKESNTTMFKNTTFEGVYAGNAYSGVVEKMSIKGYNPEVKLVEGNVLDEVNLEGITVSFDEGDSKGTLTIKSLLAKSYTYTGDKLLEIFVNPDLVDSFIYLTQHQGIEINEISLSDQLGFVAKTQKLSFSPYNADELLSFAVDKITVDVDSADTVENNLNIEKIALTQLDIPLLKIITESLSENLSTSVLVEELSKIPQVPFERKLFTDAFISKLSLNLPKEITPVVENNAITLDMIKFAYETESNSKLNLTLAFENFKLSSQYLSMAQPGILELLGPSFPAELVLNHNAVYSLDSATKNTTVDSKFDLDKLLNLELLANTEYTCESALDILAGSMNAVMCSGVKEANLSLTDKGFASVGAKLASVTMQMPPESLAPSLTGMISLMSSEMYTQNPKIDNAISQIVSGVNKFIEKPGKISIELDFNPAFYPLLSEGLQENFTLVVDVQQGEKTLGELAQ